MNRPEIVEHSHDVVVVGGGLAAGMAAWRAGQLSKSVIQVDKSHPFRSGCATTGVDHWYAYFPEVQGPEGITLEAMVEDHIKVASRGLCNREIIHYILATSLDRLMDLEKLGVKMRYEDSTLPGHFRLVYQTHTGARNTLHFDGRMLMPAIHGAVKAAGVEVADHVMMTDLLVEDGHVAGIVAYGLRDGKIHLFRSKAVVLGCGRMNRLYETPVRNSFTTRMPPANTGDGKAAMFRAGIELINSEFSDTVGRWTSKNFVRGPGSPYPPTGVAVNALGEVINPRPHERSGVRGGGGGRAAPPVAGRKTFPSEWQAGHAPFYADMSWGTDEDQEYLAWAVSNEGGGWALNYLLDKYGLSRRKHKFEIAPTEPEHSATAAAGPMVDGKCETSLPGLFAAGDEAGGIPACVAPGAGTMGWLSGESAVAHAKTVGHMPHGSGEKPTVDFVNDVAARQHGDVWSDYEAFTQQAMSYYNLHIKSETMTARALENMAYVRNTLRMVASNPHEMSHCLEVRNLIECCEIVLRSTLERKESRPTFSRVDYPNRDDENWNCWLGQRQVDGKIVFEKHLPK